MGLYLAFFALERGSFFALERGSFFFFCPGTGFLSLVLAGPGTGFLLAGTGTGFLFALAQNIALDSCTTQIRNKSNSSPNRKVLKLNG